MSQVPEIIQIKCSPFRYVEYTPKMVIKLAYTLYLSAYIWSENAKPIRLAVAVLPIALYAVLPIPAREENLKESCITPAFVGVLSIWPTEPIESTPINCRWHKRHFCWSIEKFFFCSVRPTHLHKMVLDLLNALARLSMLHCWWLGANGERAKHSHCVKDIVFHRPLISSGRCTSREKFCLYVFDIHIPARYLSLSVIHENIPYV